MPDSIKSLMPPHCLSASNSFYSEKSATFFPKEDATSLNNVVTKIEFVHVQMYLTW